MTRYAPLDTGIHGSTRSNHREVIPCICGIVLVVVARFRAACVLRLSRDCWPAAPAELDSTDVVIKWSPNPETDMRRGYPRSSPEAISGFNRLHSLERVA
ncbi:hypothetical protein GCM10023324_21120 [Streptomyces youssoufiensis]